MQDNPNAMPTDDQAMLDLTKKLIQARSISPDDAGCQALITNLLTQLDFQVEHMPFGDVSNLWACHGNGPPYFVFAEKNREFVNFQNFGISKMSETTTESQKMSETFGISKISRV